MISTLLILLHVGDDGDGERLQCAPAAGPLPSRGGRRKLPRRLAALPLLPQAGEGEPPWAMVAVWCDGLHRSSTTRNRRSCAQDQVAVGKRNRGRSGSSGPSSNLSCGIRDQRKGSRLRGRTGTRDETTRGAEVSGETAAPRVVRSILTCFPAMHSPGRSGHGWLRSPRHEAAPGPGRRQPESVRASFPCLAPALPDAGGQW